MRSPYSGCAVSYPGIVCLAALFWFLACPSLAQPRNYVIGVGQERSELMLMLLKGTLTDGIRTSKKSRSDLAALVMAYQPLIERLELSENRPAIALKGGLKIPWDDGLTKTFQGKLDNPDLEDMMSLDYPLGPVTERIPKDFDPGRFRVEALLKAVYGSSKRQVRKNLVPVWFCGKQVLFNSRNGAARALKDVGKDLEILLREKPHLFQYVFPLSGTFSWRNIKGTDRLSPHSFGIAIDLNARKGAYWRRHKKGTGLPALRRRYPHEIVSIFEKHGFIWGGKWYHYDLMHFEYRPEFSQKEKLIRASPGDY
jgi:D-alanyl-D-alanine carboxypeptidase